MKTIIYIPGLGEFNNDLTLSKLANRYAKALDLNDNSVEKKYKVEIKKFQFGISENQNTNEAIISKIEPEKEAEIVCKIYEFGYSSLVVGNFKERSVFYQSFLTFWFLILKIPVVSKLLIFNFFKPTANASISKKNDLGQILLGSIIISILTLFGVILFLGIFTTISTWIAQQPQLKNFRFPFCLWDSACEMINELIIYAKKLIHRFNDFVEILIYPFLIAFGLNLKLKEHLTSAAAIIISFNNYFDNGINKLSIIGKLEELAENIAEENPNAESEIIGYSLGSLIAIDALFPIDGIACKRFNNIKSFISIGCPHDFIILYWPNYFKRTENKNLKLTTWFNIFSDADILSSTFRNDAQYQNPNIKIGQNNILPVNIPYNVINPENSKWSHLLLLKGFKAHSMYWDDTQISSSCFNNLFFLQSKS